MTSSAASSSKAPVAVAVDTVAVPVGTDPEDIPMDEMDHYHKSTRADVEDMRRMGRKQELVRHFRLFSMVSFVALATAAWELGIFGVSPALVDGGRPALIYSSIWSFLGFGPIYLSMAEMASMAPISGSQFTWVSEFAPANCQKLLSYITGWTSTLAWQAGNGWGLLLIGTLIQAIITINVESYEAPRWQGTLITLGLIIFATSANIFGARLLPYWQNAIFALHILGYAAFVIPIWINAPKASHSDVWTNFENFGGWDNMPLAVMVGQLPSIACQVGIDSAVHMAEEVRDAAKAVPMVIIITYLVNYVFIFIAMVTISYHIPDTTAALEDTSTYPVIHVLRASMSTPWLTAVLVLISLLLLFGNLSYLASVTRDIYAFARDEGLPFSKWIATIDKRRNIPTNACILSGAITALLSLIYIGSDVAFYAITSLSTVALVQCYAISIACVLWRRIFYPETLPYARFSLGVWGIPTNIAAIFYSTWGLFWCFWPQETPVTASKFNWASPIFVAVLIFSVIYYYAFGGRKRYHAPMVLVGGRKEQ